MTPSRAIGGIRPVVDRVIDTLYPRRCAECGLRGAWVCASCFAAVTLYEEPWCHGCGAPVGGVPCRCTRLPAAIDQSRAAGPYQGWLRSAILRFKYGGEPARALHLASLLVPAARTFPSVDALVPVPLHVRRRRSRGYNQSELLARHLGDYLGYPLMTDLVRTRNTPQQARLPGDQRAANVDGAFAVTTAAPLRGASYVLIDDVLTTGATASACAAVLKDAGAGWVGVLTLAREDS